MAFLRANSMFLIVAFSILIFIRIKKMNAKMKIMSAKNKANRATLSESPFDEYENNDDRVKDIIIKKIPNNDFNGKIYMKNSKGQNVAEFTFKGSKLNGSTKYYYNDGTLLKEKNYLNNKLDGKYIVYFPNGHKLYECQLENGERIGKNTSYYSTGEVKVNQTFSKNTGKGTYEEYYKSGRIKRKGELIRIDDDEDPFYCRKGVYEEYYEGSGKLFCVGNYDDDGERIGTFKAFYENGKTLLEYDEKNYKKYDQNGKLIIDAIVEEEKVYKLIIGSKEFQNKDMDIVLDGEFIRASGNEDTFEFFFIFYTDADTYVYELDKFGTTINLEFSEKDLNFILEPSIQMSNKILNIGNFNDSIVDDISTENDGNFSENYPNGMIKRMGCYKNGKLDGYYREYYDNGMMKAVGYYKNGEKIGNWRYYKENGSGDRELDKKKE